ncbi:NADH-quinone oxidoreductase subunit N [Cytophagaceae bacterium ABcell3]|nr:NADH-quinone oxidoreductase subunit N [Cytophagaceae bacterium ABcell3]
MKALVLVAILGIVSMMADIFGYRKHLWGLALGALAIIAGITFVMDWNQFQTYYEMMEYDNYAVAFTCLLLLLTIVWVFFSKDQYNNEFNMPDHYALIFFSLVGGIVLVSFNHLAMLFIGIEILSIPLYILAGSRKNNLASNEASLKYFLMGAFATGVILFGMALLYGATGSFRLDLMAQFIEVNQHNMPAIFYTGVIMVMIGLCFKVSAFPFHFWAPDVYEGAPLFVTAYMATISKTAALGAFYRLFESTFADISYQWSVVLSVIIVLTIVIGNFTAIYQNSVKRMLAYSGIAQAGYMLMAILVLNDMARNSLLFYAASYGLATLCAFIVLYHVAKVKGSETFESFNSLGKSHPLLAFIMTVAMLSLAGIPPAVGFFAKFYLFAAVLQGGYEWVVFIAIIGSIISVYYYFRLIIAMYAKEAEVFKIQLKPSYQTLLVILAVIIIILGITPGLVINMI